MDQRTLRVLEYDAIRQRLRDCAACSLGKELAERLEPSADQAVVRALIAETTEARETVDTAGRPPLGGVTDVRPQVLNAQRAGVLTARDLQDVANSLYAARRMRGYLNRLQSSAPRLSRYAAGLGTFQEIEAAVEAAVDMRGEVVDSASEALHAVRMRIRHLQDTVSKRLESIIHSTQFSRIIQEPIVTVRNGRYCIPIRSELKGEFRGIVHDSSSSGATVFMEPLAVVEANNELREARLEEEREVRRVLAGLSLMVGDSADPILETIETIGKLDLIFARAALGEGMKATEPVLNTVGRVDLVQARHPLLTGRVVPINVHIGDEFSALIVTGPNTGGKTVSLKTLGLLTLMAQSGLHVPAASHSKVAIFSQVFADIGDEQSIAQSLSTFSSHMSQIINVLNHAAGSALVLLDEIGAGTDPAEGSALAKAVLTELLRRGARVVATTHYGELKAFAYTTPGIENASVEFDPVTLEPTFELRIGTPGSSNAFAIAARLGLSPALLREAAQMIGEAQVEFTEVIQRAEQSQRDLAEEHRKAAKSRMELEQTQAEYQRLLAEMRAERRKLLAEARDEARRIVARAKQRSEELLNLLRQSVQEARLAKEAYEREQELAAKYAPPEPAEVMTTAQEQLAEISEEAQEATAEVAEPPEPEIPAPPPEPPRDLRTGDAVLVRAVGQRGSVVEPPDANGNVQVQVGILKVTVPVAELERAREELVTLTHYVPTRPILRGPVPAELHLRGLRVDAAVYELDRYLDRAAMAHHTQVRIVHGKGTGAIRAAVHERLKVHPLVKSFRLGEAGEGDSGVTIVELVQ
jgi:DNA mismatch repair protein MutS2